MPSKKERLLVEIQRLTRGGGRLGFEGIEQIEAKILALEQEVFTLTQSKTAKALEMIRQNQDPDGAISQIEKQLEKKHKKIERLKVKRDALRERVKEVEEEILRWEHPRLKEEITKCGEEYLEAIDHRDECRRALDKAEARMEQIKERQRRAHREVTEIESKLPDLKPKPGVDPKNSPEWRLSEKFYELFDNGLLKLLSGLPRDDETRAPRVRNFFSRMQEMKVDYMAREDRDELPRPPWRPPWGPSGRELAPEEVARLDYNSGISLRDAVRDGDVDSARSIWNKFQIRL